MGFTEDVRDALNALVGQGRPFANRKRMADNLEVDPSQLNRFLSGERGLTVDTMGKILDRLRAEVRFPGQEPPSRDVVFAQPGGVRPGQGPLPDPDDYLAMPLVARPASLTPRGLDESDVDAWVVVWRGHETLARRQHLLAVPVAPEDTGMVPTLHPGDVVMVDRSDRDLDPPGRIMVVTEPGGDRFLVRRVTGRRVDNDVELVFYSDNSRDLPPRTFRLDRDFDGDFSKALVGTVIWTWSDMTKK